jgi:hypothetical protein
MSDTFTAADGTERYGAGEQPWDRAKRIGVSLAHGSALMVLKYLGRTKGDTAHDDESMRWYYRRLTEMAYGPVTLPHTHRSQLEARDLLYALNAELTATEKTRLGVGG